MMTLATRQRAILWLGETRSRGYNPAPGRQVFTAEGARKYGLPIGATILPGMRALTAAQHDEVAAMPPDVRQKYLQARAQGHTHAAARKAAGGSAPTRKAPTVKTSAPTPAPKRAEFSGLPPATQKRLKAALATVDRGDYPGHGNRDFEDLERLKSRGLIEKHADAPHGWRLTDRGHAVLEELNAPAKATPGTPAKKVAPKAATAPAKKAVPPRSPDGVPHLVTYDEDSDSWTVSGVPARDRARVAKSVHTYWDRGQDVNDYLRQGPDAYGARKGKKLAPATAQRTVDDLDTLFDSSRTDRPVEVWRGFGGRTQFGDNPDAWPDDLTGHEWTDAGYVSTAADRAEAGQFVTGGSGGPTDRRGVMARVSVPEGAPVLSLSDFEATELLLSRGWKFRVTRDHGWQTDHKRSGDVRHRVLDVEAIPPTPARKSTAAAKKAPTPMSAHSEAIAAVTKATPMYGTPAYHGVVPPLEGLTVRQQRARLRAMGFSKEQIDELAPTAAMAKKATAKAPPLSGRAVLASLPIRDDESLFDVGSFKSRDAVADYASNGHEFVNDALRQANGRLDAIPETLARGSSAIPSHYSPERVRDMVAGLDEAMGSSRTTAPVALHRGISTSKRGPFSGQLGGDLKGFEWTDSGYTSTSTEKTAARGFATSGAGVQLHISVPVGVGAIGIENPRLGSEREVLLERGLRFRVMADRTVNGERHLDVEVVSKRGTRRSEEFGSDQTETRTRDEPVDELDLALEHYEPEKPLDPTARSRALAMRAIGQDITPGHDQLHHYWTRGEGLAKWVGSPKPWTTLVAHLSKYVGPEKAKVFASRWFIEVFHFAAGSDLNRVTHGHPPRGHVVGPG